MNWVGRLLIFGIHLSVALSAAAMSIALLLSGRHTDLLTQLIFAAIIFVSSGTAVVWIFWYRSPEEDRR